MIDKLVQSIQDSLKEVGINIFTSIADNSYYIFLYLAMFLMLLYIMGHKKMGKFIPVTMVIYILLQSIKAGLKQ